MVTSVLDIRSLAMVYHGIVLSLLPPCSRNVDWGRYLVLGWDAPVLWLGLAAAGAKSAKSTFIIILVNLLAISVWMSVSLVILAVISAWRSE